MITDKQRQRDYEYDGEYQSKSRYTIEQWNHILNSGQLSEEDILLLKQIYRSFNHAATLLQLAFHDNTTEEGLLTQINAMGALLPRPMKYNRRQTTREKTTGGLCFSGEKVCLMVL